MKPMKVETCPTCRWKTIRRATCRDCRLYDFDFHSGGACYRGKTGTRICKEFLPRKGVEILKQEDNQ